MIKCYMVRRPFKSRGVFYERCTIITNPSAVKLFQCKVNEKRIVEVNENNVDDTVQWLIPRVGKEMAEAFYKAFKELPDEDKVKEIKPIQLPKE